MWSPGKKLHSSISRFLTAVASPWSSNAGWIATIFGQDAHNIDAFFTRSLPTGRRIELGTPTMEARGGKGTLGNPETLINHGILSTLNLLLILTDQTFVGLNF